MKSLLDHGAQLILSRPWSASNTISAIARTKNGFGSNVRTWTCQSCLFKQERVEGLARSTHSIRADQSRAFWTSSRWLREETERLRTPEHPAPSPESPRDLSTPTPLEASTLPSQTDQQRWQVSKRMSQIMDQLLARASIASQRINAYTGTDYSGIEALRKEIVDLEVKVRGCHKEVEETRSRHRDAHSKQASSQKEIVGLLERKSSWSPSDLERYMSLVRSEHSDEQAVQHAKDSLTDAERDLEESRSLLERLERKQYHEEQIWSDTIRRNSTWVTFGLMGVNIILLLAQIAVFEPYRRRRIVGDVQKALDEKTVHTSPIALQRIPDEVAEPRRTSPERVQEDAPPVSVYSVPSGVEGSGAQSTLSDIISTSADHSRSEEHAITLPTKPAEWSDSWRTWRDFLDDKFSSRIVQVQQVDLTTAALEGAAVGFAAMGLLIAIFRPR